MRHIKVVFQHLLKTGFTLKEIKCNFLKRHIQYLGHLISETGIEPLPEKFSSLQDMTLLGIQKRLSNFKDWPVIIGSLYQGLLTFLDL